MNHNAIRSVAVLLVASVFGPEPSIANADDVRAGVSADELQAGKNAYEMYCAQCHGMTGKGGLRLGSAVSSDLTDGEWTQGGTDEEIISTIKNGIAPAYAMQPWGNQLEDSEIRLIVAYVRSLAVASSGP